MRELTSNEIEYCSGGVDNDTNYAVAVGAAIGFLAIGVSTGGLAFIGASIISSGIAIASALSGDGC